MEEVQDITKDTKTSKAQVKAVMKYDRNNPENRRKRIYKSNGKRFIQKYATLEELEQYEQLIANRKVELLQGEDDEKNSWKIT